MVFGEHLWNFHGEEWVVGCKGFQAASRVNPSLLGSPVSCKTLDADRFCWHKPYTSKKENQVSDGSDHDCKDFLVDFVSYI